MPITVAMRTQVAQLYVSLFGRAPDGEGLGFWVGKLDAGDSFASVAQQMYNTTPARTIYPTFLTNEEIVTRFYTNTLGRSPDAEGLAFWTAKLNVKGATVGGVIAEIISVVANYRGTDAAGIASANLFNNKVSVAQYYGEANKDAAGAAAAIASVTADPATVAAARAAIDAPAPVAGSSFTLTTGVDTGAAFTGGAGNDTFNASGTTLTAGDSLNGGAGADTLNITTTAAASVGTGVSTSGIEVISVTATGGAASVNAAAFSGVTNVRSVGSTEDVTVSGLTAIPARVAATGINKNLTISMADAAVVGTADGITIDVDGVATTANSTITVNGIENVTVNATGANSGGTTTAVTVASDSLRSVTLTGTATDKVAVTLSGVNASTITGSVVGSASADDIQINGLGAGGTRLSVAMGDGNDTVRLSSVASTYTIDGGAGTDTLVWSGAAAATTATAGVTGFENVTVTTGVSLGVAASAVTYSTTVPSSASATYTNLASGGTVNLPAGGTLTLANTAWATPTTDSVTVNVGTSGSSSSATATVSGGVVADKVESITLNALNSSTATATATNTLSASGDTLATIVVTSQIGATLSGGGTALRTIDASGVVGAFSSSATISTAGATITGGAGADTLAGSAGNDSIVGGSGADSITGGAGADTLTGGAGADVFVYGTNSASVGVSNSATTDTITDFVSGTDRLQIAQQNDSFIGNFANITAALAAMTANNQSFFVTSENNVYVVATQGTLASTDTVIKLTGVTSLTAADVSTGSQAGGNDLIMTAAAGTLATYDATTRTATTTSGLPTATSAFNDTVRISTGSVNIDGTTTLAGGNGVDTLAIYGQGTAATTVTLPGTVTGFEVFTINNSLGTATTSQTTTGTVTLNGIANANVAPNLATAVSFSAASLSTASVVIDASGITTSTTAANRSVSITGGTFTGGDTLTGGAGNDTIDGGIGNDVIDGGAGVDSIIGGEGNDTIAAQAGWDTIDAGPGDDTINLATGTYGDATSGNFVLSMGAGTNVLNLVSGTNLTRSTITATGGTYALNLTSTGAGNTYTLPMALVSGANSVTATAGTETVTFSTAGTIDVSGTGRSDINGFVLATGTNSITIGASQTVAGASSGTGTDTISFTGANAAAFQNIGNMGSGTDTVSVTGDTAVSVTLPTTMLSVEAITFANTTTNVSLTTRDQNVADTSSMSVTASSLTSGTLTFNGSQEASGAFSITGGGANDTITGGGGNDTLVGGSGTDSITGGAGADYLDGGAAGDFLLGGDGNDTIVGGAGNDQIEPGVGVDVIYLTSTAGEATTVADRVVFAAGTAVNGQPATAATAGMNTIVGLIDGATRVISSNAVLSVSGVDVIYGFAASAQLAVEGLRNSADSASLSLNSTILRSGDVMSGSADSSSQGLVRGTYDAASGTFTVSLTGTSSIYFYDADPSASVSIRGVVLVGYVDAAANDTGGATGLIGVGG